MKTWTTFFKSNKHSIQIAVDTEFQGNTTLTIQVAVRLGKTIYVQLYCDSTIPRYQRRYLSKQWRREIGKLGKIVVLPPRPMTADLSVARFITHICQLEEPKYRSRHASLDAFNENNVFDVEVTWVSHFLRADLLRALGSRFLARLLVDNGEQGNNLALCHRRVLSFSETGGKRFQPPVVEHVLDGDHVYALRLRTVDTTQLIKGTLDAVSKSILGIGKLDSSKPMDKTQMQTVFNNLPGEAYPYAVQDAVITLCLYEELERQQAAIYRELGINQHPERLLGTTGRQASALLSAYIKQMLVTGKASNENKQLNQLMKGGGASIIAESSKFGVQTSSTQGGLSYSRSPTRFVHRARSMFLDADLSSCYPGIIKHINYYLGQPVVLEPGNEASTMAQMVTFVEEFAAGHDAWFMRVTGKIPSGINALIKSVENPLTYENYKRQYRRRRASLRLPAQFDSFHEKSNKVKSCLLTHEVNFGIVTAATWAIIQALPGDIRQEYENLRVESLVFYPRGFVAGSLKEYKRLCEKRHTGKDLPWRQALNLKTWKLETQADIDEDYVSIRFPMREFMSRMIDMRLDAGKNKAMGKCIKLITNSMYGVIASPLMGCNNVVAANVITDTARALAFAMHLSLNGIQAITDGVTFRRDQIPARTLTSVLRSQPDYPLKRAEKGITFVDPTSVPTSPSEFKLWYPSHVLRFFGVAGQSRYEELFRQLDIDLKNLPGTSQCVFDGLVVEGNANYMKLLRKDKRLVIVDFKARSFMEGQRKDLQNQLKKIYLKDRIVMLEPVEGTKLAKAKEALQIIENMRMTASSAGCYFPLGSEWPDLKLYKLIKPAMFHLRDERQRRSFQRLSRKVEKMTKRGLEILAMAVPGIAAECKLSAVAERIYQLLRSDKPLRNLNVDKRLVPNSPVILSGEEIELRRKQLREERSSNWIIKGKKPLTGLILKPEEVERLRVVG